MKKCTLRGTLLLLGALLSISLSAQVSGFAFQDVNANGNQDAGPGFNEPGFGGVTVTGYGADGTVYGPVVTDFDGSYTLPGVSQPARVEFTLPNTFLQAGTSGGTTVQFVDGAATGVSVAVLDPENYCDSTNPRVIASCYLQGDPTVPGSQANTGDALVLTDYELDLNPRDVATGGEVGTIWGSAWSALGQRLFSATLLKRHAGYGSLGLGGIYATDYDPATDTYVTGPFIDITTIGVNLGADPRADPANENPGEPGADDPGCDQLTYDMVGKVGIGDMDFSVDGHLWLMSLGDQMLYRIFVGMDGMSVPTAADVTMFPTPDPGCVDGQWRPWAIKLDAANGRLLIGGVCSNEDIANYPASDPTIMGAVIPFNDLNAYVYEFDLTTEVFNTTPLLQVPLNYKKGCAQWPNGCQWFPWNDRTDPAFRNSGNRYIHPQPVLTDIEILTDGDLVLGFLDRAGMQVGVRSPRQDCSSEWNQGAVSGDILRVDYDGTNYTLENNAFVATPGNGIAPNNNQGPGGGEFYSDDIGGHRDRVIGGLATLTGTNTVISSMMDPEGIFQGGLGEWSETGELSDGIAYYTGSGGPTFAKGQGIGDVVAMCAAAPVEIGNLVWLDENMNGVQDPEDPGIAGVTVGLYLPGETTPIATAVTDANGNYIFSTATNQTSTASFVYGLDLTFGDDYVLQIVGAEGSAQQAPLDATVVTFQNDDATANGDARDSDGTRADDSQIAFTLGFPGQNNHTYDFGFFEDPPVYDVALTKALVATSPATAIRPGDPVSFEVTVINQSTVPVFDLTVADYFDAGELTFTGLSASATSAAGSAVTVTGAGPGFVVEELASGDQVVVTLSFTVDPAFTGTQLVNNAEIIAAAESAGGPQIADEDSPLAMINDGSTNELDSDDEIADDSTGGADDPNDEDDYDAALVEVCQAGCGAFPWVGNK